MSSCKAVKSLSLNNLETERRIEQGIASWYGPNFHGKKTANGEIYDMNELTAAHRTLPFNSLVKVVNKKNGKSVTVRINDRGPYIDNRIIDLSKKAAEQLEMIQSGTTTVVLILLKSDSKITKDLTVPNYAVQIGSFTDKPSAIRKQASVPYSRIEEAEVQGRKVFRVYVGLFTDPAKAGGLKKELMRNRIDGFVKQVEN
ncbi:MAG: rare lipoprotein A [Cyclobacteriaceae bacterium]|jgi:rare lipoprotein A